MRSILRNSFVCGLVALLCGCAAQDSHRILYQAEQLYLEAQKRDPLNPELAAAKKAMDDGRQEMFRARYDLAHQQLRESMRVSEGIINSDKDLAKTLKAPAPIVPPAAESETPKAQVPEVKEPAAVVKTPSFPNTPLPQTTAKKAEEINKPRALPKEALAKYLAAKKFGPAGAANAAAPAAGAGAAAMKPTPAKPAPVKPAKPAPEKAAVVVERPKPQMPEPREIPKEAATEDKPVKEIVALETPAVETQGTAPEVPATPAPALPTISLDVKPGEAPQVALPAPVATGESEVSDEPDAPRGDVISKADELLAKSEQEASPKSTVTRSVKEASKEPAKSMVIAAPAKKVDKFLPKSVVEKNARVESLPTPSTIGQKPMSKIPGMLRFNTNDAALESDVRMNLDQTSRFLLDNPSTTLVFQGVTGPNESSSLTDTRYEVLRKYLIGKGVPDDQVRLDVKRRQGPRAEFEMFVIEH